MTGPAPREGRTSNLAWICLSALRDMSSRSLPDLQLALPSEAVATDALASLRKPVICRFSGVMLNSLMGENGI